MAFSKIQIVSNSLILLGDNPISSFSDTGAGARAASNLYESTYLSLLSSHRWKFATKKAALSRLTETPLNEYMYQFQLPTDLVLLISTYPVSTYEILEDKLYTDSTSVSIDYVYRVDESRLPKFFIKTFEYFLASDLAIPVTEDINKMDVMYKKYQQESRKARYADSQSQPSVGIVDDPYIRIRAI